MLHCFACQKLVFLCVEDKEESISRCASMLVIINLHTLIICRLLAPRQVAKSNDVYSCKFILDCVKQNQLLDISAYRLVCKICRPACYAAVMSAMHWFSYLVN